MAGTATKQRSRQRRTRPPPAAPQRKAVAAVDLLDNERGPGSKDPGHPNSHDANRSESNGNTDCNHSVAPEPDQPRFEYRLRWRRAAVQNPAFRLYGSRAAVDRAIARLLERRPGRLVNSQSSVTSSAPGSRSSLPARWRRERQECQAGSTLAQRHPAQHRVHPGHQTRTTRPRRLHGLGNTRRRRPGQVRREGATSHCPQVLPRSSGTSEPRQRGRRQSSCEASSTRQSTSW